MYRRALALVALLILLSSTAAAQPATFDLIQPANGLDIRLFENDVTHKAEVETDDLGTAEVIVDGTVVETVDSGVPSSFTVEATVNNQPLGMHWWSVTFENDTGEFAVSPNWTYEIVDINSSVNLVSPGNGERFGAVDSAPVDFEYKVTSDDGGTARLFINDTLSREDTVPSGERVDITHRIDITLGKWNWYVELEEPSETIQSNRRNFTVAVPKDSAQRSWFVIIDGLRELLDPSFLSGSQKVLAGLIMVVMAAALILKVTRDALPSLIGAGVVAMVLPLTPIWPEELAQMLILIAGIIIFAGVILLGS